MDKGNYEIWAKRIDLLSNKMKQMFSNECNSLYDHHCKMYKFYKNDWVNVAYNVRSVMDGLKTTTLEKDDMFDDFDEGELERLFRECDGEQGNQKDELFGKRKVSEEIEKKGSKKLKSIEINEPLTVDEIGTVDGNDEFIAYVCDLERKEEIKS